MKTSAIDFRIHLFSTETATQTNHPNKDQDEKEPNSTKWEEQINTCDVDSTFTLLAHSCKYHHNIRGFQHKF